MARLRIRTNSGPTKRIHVERPARAHPVPAGQLNLDAAVQFNPRLPCGKRPADFKVELQACVFQSAPPVREATVVVHRGHCLQQVSIRASRAGSDQSYCAHEQPQDEFQSAPPVREATSPLLVAVALVLFQSAPPVREATAELAVLDYAAPVSIRASRAGSDSTPVTSVPQDVQFQSAPPVREATSDRGQGRLLRCVSIRASRAGSDRRR